MEPVRLFAFRLALTLGYLHPDKMLRELTWRQFVEWQQYYCVEPFGEERADLRAGIIASVMSNRWRGKHEEPKKPSDFMPFLTKKVQTPEQIKFELRSILTRVNTLHASRHH